MDKYLIGIIGIIGTILGIIGSTLYIVQYIQVTPLERENARLKEKLTHTSEQVESTQIYKKLRNELNICKANNSVLERKTTNDNKLNNQIASLNAEGSQCNQNFITYKKALGTCQENLSRQYQLSNTLNEINKLQKKQDKLEEELKSETNSFQPQQKILNVLNLRIQRLQEQIKTLSLSLNK